MATTLSGLTAKNLDKPDQTIAMPGVSGGTVAVGDSVIGRGTIQPGWRWSKDVKPKVGTESCQEAHTMYAVSGRLHVRMTNGDEIELGAGDACFVPPGHDAWVVGDEPFVELDFARG